MILDVRGTVLAAPGRFVRPRYDGWSFANVSPSLLRLFGVDCGRPPLAGEVLQPLLAARRDHVILLLIDGLGFDTWVERAVRYPFFGRVAERGQLTSLTATFPSTTSASLTALSTGLTPREHGLPEWNLYLEEIDEVIVSLPFKRWFSKRRDELEQLGLTPRALFTGRTIYETLADAGVPTVCFTPHDYVDSAYSRASHEGARTVGFTTSRDLVERLGRELEEAARPTFFYIYWDRFDSLEHEHSPRSQAAELELRAISGMLRDRLEAHVQPEAARRTLLVVTADHGQVEVTPPHTVYLTDFPEVLAFLRLRPGGQRILPTGSMRDVFIHVQPGKVEEARAFLAHALAGKAEVLRSRDAIDDGLFGPGPSAPRFESRVGDLIVLPYEGESVWAQYPGMPRPHRMRGHHGGLSPSEMFIPFGTLNLEELWDR